MDRRTYLATGAVIALAGCTELGGPGETDDEETEDDHDDDERNGDDTNGEDESAGDPELAGTFDDFEDLEPWEAFQDIGTIEADTERAYDGSQSARLVPDSDGQVRVRRYLDDPIDITEVTPGLAMTAEDSGMVLIQLQDEDGDYVEYSQQVLGDMPLARKNFGLTRVRGEPDLENIVILQIIRWFGNGEEVEEDDEDDEELEESDGADDDTDDQMWVDDFHFVPNTNPGKVMIQFHGGYETHYTEAYPLVSEYDYPATTFVPTDRLRSDPAVEGDRLTHEQVDELADAGWTIGAQPANGLQLHTVDPDRVEEVVTEPADWLEDEGYDGARFFSFPGSRYTEQSYELVQDTYDLGFAGQTQCQGYAGNPHLCSMVSNPSADQAEGLLEWTAEHGGITSIAFYQLEESDALGGLEATLAGLDEYVDSGDLEVITPEEMADEYVYEDD
ncbi:polysaccharide deacetylase [Natronococcus pandeyae]|uniref:Polysaccharide deacetylase n=1 Tax=Natronococcus pandeyae TaxID=2055836 RepID=A0A8J8Q1K0_9EURY|nr:polysaccharide deacetylase family protein [Natronococcus pandeyae]TYL36723.1 polysaccharide deacetylase [Natronococcus pandeyae]